MFDPLQNIQRIALLGSGAQLQGTFLCFFTSNCHTLEGDISLMNLICASVVTASVFCCAFTPGDHGPAAGVQHMAWSEAHASAFAEIICLGGARSFRGTEAMLRMVLTPSDGVSLPRRTKQNKTQYTPNISTFSLFSSHVHMSTCPHGAFMCWQEHVSFALLFSCNFLT